MAKTPIELVAAMFTDIQLIPRPGKFHGSATRVLMGAAETPDGWGARQVLDGVVFINSTEFKHTSYSDNHLIGVEPWTAKAKAAYLETLKEERDTVVVKATLGGVAFRGEYTRNDCSDTQLRNEVINHMAACTRHGIELGETEFPYCNDLVTVAAFLKTEGVI